MEWYLEIQAYSVSGLTADIRYLLENSFPPVWVEGEISNFVHHRSGHMYFSLKDEGATLRCVFFKQNNFRREFEPGDGMKVLAFGELSVYEPSGQYQLKIARLKPAGVGELALAFEQLKARLAEEGLFSEDRKRPLPGFPKTVGVVTSPTGAAVRDIISVISRRCPPVRIVLVPVRVQGEGAGREIAAAIESLGQWGEADVIIAGRGGGSLEDLWAFNEEVVARAIFGSPVPVISAVGHETDFTIADFVADRRAPTPSAAAELAVPDAAGLAGWVRELSSRLTRSIQDEFERGWQLVDGYERGLSPRRLAGRLQTQHRRLDSLVHLLASGQHARFQADSARWNTLRRELSALNPASVLGRGFSVARNAQGEAVREAGQVSPGDSLELILSRGRLDCRVESVDTDGAPLAASGRLPELFIHARRATPERERKK